MTGSSRLTSANLRAAVRKHVDATSLRSVADEIGMSFSGLRSYLEGRTPQRKTRVKLMNWYYVRSRHSAAVSKEDFETAIEVVITFLKDESKPREVRARQVREVVNRLEDASG